MKLFKEKYVSDNEFDKVFPNQFRGEISHDHWTPVHIAKQASLWLSEDSDTICDLGCGVGKFCFVGAVLTDSHYTGIDYRKSVITYAKQITKKYKLEDKISFINQDFSDVDLSGYTGFYFFNPYLEHFFTTSYITSEIKMDISSIKIYTKHLKDFFSKVENNISIVTYDNVFSIIPKEVFKLKKTENGLNLYQNF